MGLGINSQVGVAPESTYGTPVAPTRFYEFTSESLEFDKGVVQSSAIRKSAAGLREGRLAARRYVVTRGGNGSLAMDFTTKGMGAWLKYALGTSVITTPGGGTLSRLNTLTPGSQTPNESFTVQKGVEEASGTVKPFTFHGGKIESWELSCTPDQLLMLSLGMDFEDMDTSTGLAGASFVASEVFHFAHGAITVGGGAVARVTNATVSGTNGLKTDSHFLGGGGLKAEPESNDFLSVGGTIDAEFVSQAALVDRYIADTSAALVLTYTSTVAIEGALFPYVKVTIPSIKFDGEVPKVGGPELVATSAPFTALWDGSTPTVTIEVQSTDTTSIFHATTG